MKTKFLPILFAIILSTNLFASNPQMVTTKKGVIREIAFPLTTLDAEELAVGVTAATCRISKDGGVLANTTNSFSAIGEGFYKITLTASETDAAYIAVICSHATEFYDKTILVNTYGEAGAFHVPEVVEADIVSVNSVAVTNVNDFKATGFSTFNSVSDTVTLADNGITAAKIASNAITNVKIASNAITDTKIASGTLTAAKFGASAITSTVLADNAITSTKIAASALNGKGDWNIGKTGYSLTQTFPANFATLGINVSGHISRATLVDTTTTNTDMNLLSDEDVWTYATRHLTADGLSDSSISTAAANKIADHIIRRSTANVEASSDGDTLNFKSLYGVAAQQTHKSAIAAGNWTVYQANGSTTLNTRSVSSSGSASPIVGAD